MINKDKYSPTVEFSYEKNKDWFQQHGGGVGFGNDKESPLDNEGYDEFGYDDEGKDREGYKKEDYQEYPYLRNLVYPDYHDITINEVFEKLNAAEDRYENTRIPELEKELSSIENKIIVTKNMINTVNDSINNLNQPSNVVLFKKPLTKEEKENEKEKKDKDSLDFYRKMGIDDEEAKLLVKYVNESVTEDTIRDNELYDLEYKKECLEDELYDLELEKSNLDGKILILKSAQKSKKLTDVVDNNVVKPRKGFSKKR